MNPRTAVVIALLIAGTVVALVSIATTLAHLGTPSIALLAVVAVVLTHATKSRSHE